MPTNPEWIEGAAKRIRIHFGLYVSASKKVAEIIREHYLAHEKKIAEDLQDGSIGIDWGKIGN